MRQNFGSLYLCISTCDLTLFDSFVSYQEGGISWSFKKNDKQYKGSPTDTM